MAGSGHFHASSGAGESGERAVLSALDRLDGEARLLLALLFVEGLNEAEAAAVLDRSVEDVRALAEAAQHALALSVAGAVPRRAA